MNPTVLALLDEMEDLIANAPALPVAGRIIVDRAQLLEIIDAMRVEALQHTHAAQGAAHGPIS
jgi:hypothetical protein